MAGSMIHCNFHLILDDQIFGLHIAKFTCSLPLGVESRSERRVQNPTERNETKPERKRISSITTKGTNEELLEAFHADAAASPPSIRVPPPHLHPISSLASMSDGLISRVAPPPPPPPPFPLLPSPAVSASAAIPPRLHNPRLADRAKPPSRAPPNPS
jgi:hypothetical protein